MLTGMWATHSIHDPLYTFTKVALLEYQLFEAFAFGAGICYGDPAVDVLLQSDNQQSV